MIASAAILVLEFFLTTYDKVYMPRPGRAGPGRFLGLTVARAVVTPTIDTMTVILLVRKLDILFI